MDTIKRIITRPDFDGVVCAVLLKAALGQHLEILWAQPNEMQHGLIQVGPQDVISNLPYHEDCALWFDHHVSNEPQTPFEGLYRVAPSAAGLVYEYYQERLSSQFRTLVQQADKIDAAQLNLDEILRPERYPFILLSMTIFNERASDVSYCDELVALLNAHSISAVLTAPRVKRRCEHVLAENKAYEKHLKRHTRMRGNVSITDFRGIEPVPNGNRFLVYSLFPQAVVNMKIFHENSKTVVKLGHSILNRGCNVNVGRLLSRYGGGGHRGAGACRLDNHKAEHDLQAIQDILVANKNEAQDNIAS